MGGRLQRGRKLDGKQRRHLLLAVMLPIVIVVVAATFAAQDTGPANSAVASFKVDVGLVNLNVTVNDATGRPYTALKEENFRVYDNGTEQAIHHFSSDDVPFTMGLVLDRSGSMFMMMKEVYQAAFHTILNSKAEDEFFITTFNEQSGIQQDFTTDRQVLEQQLKQVQAGGATALYDAIL